MDKAIKKAIEGEWSPNFKFLIRKEGFKRTVELKYVTDYWFSGTIIENSGNVKREYDIEIATAQILQSVEFWQALGKSLKWGIVKCEICSTTDFIGCARCKQEWKIKMHSFIDHLIEKKEIDLFFKELLTVK